MRVIGFHCEVVVVQMRLWVLLSGHPIDSINLKDFALGFFEEFAEFIAKTDVSKKQLHIALNHNEHDTTLTINEFKTLLMKYDLTAILHNPFQFITKKTRQTLANPHLLNHESKQITQHHHEIVFHQQNLELIDRQHNIALTITKRDMEPSLANV